MIRRILENLARLFLKNHVTTYRRGIERGIKVRGKLGFLGAFREGSKEDRFLQGLMLENKIIYDVGGFVGIMTIFFAHRAVGKGKVITFEPNPKNCDIILENLKLNNVSNVLLRQTALGAESGVRTFVIRKDMPETGTAQDDLKDQILEERETNVDVVEFEVDTLDNQIFEHKLPKPDFVKIDVEGLELDVLRGMRETILDYKPELFVEIHGADQEGKLENIKNIVSFLESYDYDMLHIETEQHVNSMNAGIAKEGHIYCF